MTVEIVHWNPVRATRRGLLGKLAPRRRPVDNFGDLLGPVVCREVVTRRGLDFESATASGRILAAGSIMTMARPGDVIWGTGVNGKLLDEEHDYSGLDVRAVRGPLTRSYLQSRGVSVPEVFGDPGLLVGSLWARDELRSGRPRVPVAVVPNFHDARLLTTALPVISPQLPLWECIGQIAASDFVVGSSLHGVIVAEALGIPARFVASAVEPEWKYVDYYEGSGRTGLQLADSVDDAVRKGPQEALIWSAQELLDAFPIELWQ